MTDTFDRRRFLNTAVLGGATVVGASALGSFAPEAAFAANRPDGGAGTAAVEPLALDPNFAEGRITGIDGSLLLVTGSDKRFHRIYLTGATSIWKLRPVGPEAAQLGDGLYARGVLLDDGTLAADAVWLNIVNLTVHVTSIGKDVIHFDHHGNRIVGHVVAGTTAAVYNSTPPVSDLTLLRVGSHAQIIGAWRPDTNEVDIATVYAAA
jgi:hypothetical protein